MKKSVIEWDYTTQQYENEARRAVGKLAFKNPAAAIILLSKMKKRIEGWVCR